ncbi:MAG: amino acid permease, partial [Gemmataceae bacterium]
MATTTNSLFATKNLNDLLAEAEGHGRLKRVLGPVGLTALGIGAIIGAGIFVATGAAAREVAGPALMLSYMIAGMTCIFAALCYAEFASMAPVAGSAYTYAYCTLGELFAWIIGWDLVLEYAVGSATVANGWSSYFQAVMKKAGWELPTYLQSAPIKFNHKAPWGDLRAWFEPTDSYINLPAVIVVFIVTVVLVKGIRESATFNAVMVFIKTFAVVFVIVMGAFFVNPENWTRDFAPFGYGGFSFFGVPQLTIGQVIEGRPVGMLAGAAIIFFAYIGFDAVSTQAEEAKNPGRDVPIGIIGSLVICTLLYIGVVAVLTGMVPYDQIDKGAGVSSAFKSAAQ